MNRENREKKWCEGGGTRQADAQGACPVCGFKGKPTKHGVVRDHKERVA